MKKKKVLVKSMKQLFMTHLNKKKLKNLNKKLLN